MVSPRCCASAGADPRGAPPAACCASHDFFGHPGLSNAGLPGEEQHHGAPVRDLAERRFDRGRLRVAPDEGVGHERRVGLCHRLTIRLPHMSNRVSSQSAVAAGCLTALSTRSRRARSAASRSTRRARRSTACDPSSRTRGPSSQGCRTRSAPPAGPRSSCCGVRSR